MQNKKCSSDQQYILESCAATAVAKTRNSAHRKVQRNCITSALRTLLPDSESLTSGTNMICSKQGNALGCFSQDHTSCEIYLKEGNK